MAVVVSHPPGFGGMPAAGHCSSAARTASCAASSARPTSPVMRASVAITRADSIRQIASIAAGVATATEGYPVAVVCSGGSAESLAASAMSGR